MSLKAHLFLGKKRVKNAASSVVQKVRLKSVNNLHYKISSLRENTSFIESHEGYENIQIHTYLKRS